MSKKQRRQSEFEKTQEVTEDTSARPDPGNRSGRTRRTNVGGARDVLAVKGERDPNYNYRVVNIEGSRIEDMIETGYEIDQDKNLSIGTSNQISTGSSHEVVVDRKSGQKAVLMRQPMEFHKEDQKLRAEKIMKTEQDIYRNVTDADEGKYATLSITRDGT